VECVEWGVEIGDLEIIMCKKKISGEMGIELTQEEARVVVSVKDQVCL
jgi:hypothetical protein